MIITYLGHAGFCVETTSSLVIIDPWFYRYGAFDSAWFQYPKNHHLSTQVKLALNSTKKDKYIYISHEHKDHFDIHFLNELNIRDFTLILANFHHQEILSSLQSIDYECKNILLLNDEESINLKDGSITLFIHDVEIENDSSILVKADNKSFLNINDCKIHEKIGHICNKYGPIDIFTSQFSGAIWHPTCYEIDKNEYEKISKQKLFIKFELTLRAIQQIHPTIYFPSAGPPCFLDPLLLDKNFESINIFPRASRFIDYLNHNCKNLTTIWPEIMPGDVWDANENKFIQLAEQRVSDENFESYVRSYAKEYKSYFELRENQNKLINPYNIFIKLEEELKKKLHFFKQLSSSCNTLIYWSINEYPNKMYCIDLANKKIFITDKIDNSNHFFKISAPAWQISKVLEKEISWADFALTFRVNLQRKPDLYHSIIHAYITLNTEQLPRFCQLFKNYHDSNERIIVEYEGKQFSVLRYCPHQGGDLKHGWIKDGYLICPKHGWKYKLTEQGKCLFNHETIEAICLNDNHTVV